MIIYDFLLAASVLLFVWVALFYLRHPAASLLHPATIYLAFHGIIFVFRPILARVFDYQGIYRAYQFQPSIDDKITVILGANLGFLVFMGVSLLVAGQPFENRQDRFDQMQRRLMIKPFLVVGVILAPICFASIIDSWIVSSTASSTMIIDQATGTTINTTANGWFAAAQLALAPLTITFAWLFRFRLWALAPFAIYATLAAGTGTRGPLIVAAMALAMLYLFETRRRWPEWRATLLLLTAALAFNFIVADRGKVVREFFVADISETYISQDDWAPLETMDFANQEFFEYVVYVVPQRSGTYDYFLSNLQIFTEPVPRVWWRDKPIGPPIQRIRLFEYGTPIGMTLSLPGAGWYSLGYLGIIIQCGVFALGYGLLYRWLMAGRQSNLYLLAYSLMVAATVVTFRDGVLITVARMVPFYVGPLVFLWLIMKAFNIPAALALRRQASRSAVVPEPRHMSPSERRKLLASQDAAS